MTLSDQSRGAMNQIGGGIYASGLVPVVIGVTGHRDIPASDVDALAKATRAALDESFPTFTVCVAALFGRGRRSNCRASCA